ncbi:Putative TRAM/LAG1/CLN8 domain-containing protein [Septoria linicola]|uniref:TRAM/LAG1/CLN8 domain-containing protein n=1 Tax=Septoria linicola TaxID=215465 RepID=A0A9Q9EK35_9PEZI|nr:Putative TRAM/LAG1/CLN8 domain-containing protein [Septoria linicola]
MKDPFPLPPPEWLVANVQPLAEYVGLPTLALHAHEVIFAFCLYTFIGSVVSPILSTWLVPDTYKSLNHRTKVNWDVHVVSFFQSVLICALSLYVMFYDEERKAVRPRAQWEGRVWEYTGMSGLCQSFALGYFLWDLIQCTYHVEIFGIGMLAHAISAVSVFALGYRPFLYFYAPVFLLYELSSPLLNIHWFCDKLNLTGSPIQAINGAFLVASFFSCRLVWGNYSSVLVFIDVYNAVFHGNTFITKNSTLAPTHYSTQDLLSIYADEQGQRLAFAGGEGVPLWLGLVYLASNLTLNSLNIFWFGKMIETIRSRFEPPLGTKGVGKDVKHWEPEEKIKAAAKDGANAARAAAERVMNAPILQDDVDVQKVTQADGSKSVEVTQRTLRTRRKA